jgi:Fe-S cluster assembly iron-binding protein IscA
MFVDNYGVVASDNNTIYPDYAAAHNFTYDASGNLITDTFVDFNGNVYRQTFTYTNGNLTNVGVWVKQ